MPTEAKVQAERRKQSAASKAATIDLLKNKRPATKTFSLFIQTEDGEVEVTMTFKAIGSVAYDKLMAKHPPKAEQRVEGLPFNPDTFSPALIAACSVDPVITPEDAKEIWASDEWSRGDLMVLYTKAVELNNRGIDIPFSEND